MLRQFLVLAAFAPSFAFAHAFPPLAKLNCVATFKADNSPGIGRVLMFEGDIFPATASVGGVPKGDARLKLFLLPSKFLNEAFVALGSGRLVSANVSYHQTSYNFYDISLTWNASWVNQALHALRLVIDFSKGSSMGSAQGTYTSPVSLTGQSSFPVRCDATR